MTCRIELPDLSEHHPRSRSFALASPADVIVQFRVLSQAMAKMCSPEPSLSFCSTSIWGDSVTSWTWAMDPNTLKATTISELLMARVACSAGQSTLRPRPAGWNRDAWQALCKDCNATLVLNWDLWMVPQLEKQLGNFYFLTLRLQRMNRSSLISSDPLKWCCQ